MRILLTGVTGQVGHELFRSLQPLGSIVATKTPAEPAVLGMPSINLDLAEPGAIRQLVREVAPSLIVNAAAYTAVDKAEQDAPLAEAVNATAPRVLAEEAKRLGAGLIHYSTDYVFDGSGTSPRHEDDQVNPLNVYGRTKLEGERAIAESGCRHLVLRTSWVYGVHGKNFVKTMLKLGAERSELAVVSDQIGAPTSARVLADTTALIVARGGTKVASGVFHLTCGEAISWHGFAEEIFRLARSAGYPLKVERVRPIATEDYPVPAKRPKNSRLDCSRLAVTFDLRVVGWRTALALSFSGILQNLA